MYDVCSFIYSFFTQLSGGRFISFDVSGGWGGGARHLFSETVNIMGHPFSAVRRPIVAVLGQFKGHAKQTVVSYLGYAQFCTQHS